jgi:hypothetical protein
VGATWSQHKFGHALDVVPVKASAQEMAFDILGDQTDPAREFWKSTHKTLDRGRKACDIVQNE